jgi:hypothetical protein
MQQIGHHHPAGACTQPARPASAGCDHRPTHRASSRIRCRRGGLSSPLFDDRGGGRGMFRPRHHILGSDVAGRVEATGRNATSYGPAMICSPTSDKGQVHPGQNVLINGAGGGAGMYAVQLAKLHGADVTGVDNAEKLEFMHSLGADHVIDYTREDFTRNGRTYDLVLDLAAHRSEIRLQAIAEARWTVPVRRRVGGDAAPGSADGTFGGKGIWQEDPPPGRPPGRAARVVPGRALPRGKDRDGDRPSISAERGA